MLTGKTIVLGVTGGIAAFKVVEIASSLKKLDADVRVIMTENAARFVTPLTFRSVTLNPVVTGMFEEPKNWGIEHISLAKKADLILVAPATANIIGKVANGIADDMLSTTIMASKSPVMFCPAMNHDMYDNRIVQRNISILREMGYLFIEPVYGRMAEGSYGKGRLPEPFFIVEEVRKVLLPQNDLMGKKILVTAGPTREPLDPVRYITNRSSGKMGFAFAKAAVQRGAAVTVVCGPVSISPPDGINMINVVTAAEMRDKVMELYGSCDIIILVAAVADYRPAEYSSEKIKKGEDDMALKLEKNPDIAVELGKVKGNRILVGTCAETNNIVKNAKAKLLKKNFDIIMANDVTMEGAGFEADTNIISIITKDGRVQELPVMTKLEAANSVLDEVVGIIRNMF